MKNKKGEVSKYQKNEIAKKSRVMLSALFDYFLNAILLILLFIAVSTPVYQNLPGSKTTLNNMSEVREELNSIVNSTRLLQKENNKLESLEEAGGRYLVTLSKTSYYFYNEEYPSKNGKGTYDMKVPFYQETLMYRGDKDSYPNDDIRYFFTSFYKNKLKKSSLTLNDIYREHLKFTDLSSSSFSSVTEEEKERKKIESSYQVLTLDKAKEVMNYYIYNDKTDSKTVNALLNRVMSALQDGIDEVQKEYTPFIEKNSEYHNLYSNYERGLLITELITYVISFVLIYLAYPLSQIPFKTIGEKSLHLELERKDEMKPEKGNITVFILGSFVTGLSSLALPFLFNGMLSVLSFPLFRSFSLLWFSGIFFGIDIISLALILMTPLHQSLSLVISNLTLKDREQFISKPISDDMLMKKKEEYGSKAK